jgi:SAM-dependent methyltransferase
MSRIFDPDLYDIDTPAAFLDDVEWYRQRAREAEGPVLELGAGTGRITIPLAQAGVSVTALDVDPGMLEALRRKLTALPADVQARVDIAVGDMRSFRLERRFALVIAPYRAFLHNLTRDDQLACLQCVHEHLQPDGRFAFNVFHPSLEYMARHAGALAGVWRWTGTHALPNGGHLLRSETAWYDTVQQRVHALHRYEEFGPSGDLTRTFLERLEVAYLYPADIRQRLAEAGFGAVEIYGDFHGRPLTNDTDELVVVARRDG